MQKDLFEIKSADSIHFPGHDQESNFLQRRKITLAFDHLLVVLIVSLVALSLVYTMGVEEGKRTERKHQIQLRRTIQQTLTIPTISKSSDFPIPADTSRSKSQQESPAFFESGSPLNPSRDSQVISGKAMLTSPNRPLDGSAKPTGKYTIQIVMFKQKLIAENLRQKLAKQGLQSFIYSTGKYFNVCTNGFDSHLKAVLFLKDLKGQGVAPTDAYIRNMPRT
ncbi:MAG: SPOR domain-containing protein [Candidatus Omnitrophica bacterium]|nr:SPOR domain-containing protein [Candidatus Omnitrophota bacterium]